MSSDTIDRTALDEYAETLLARQLSTINGVAQVFVFGNSKYAVRVQADPDALAARQIGIDTLSNAIASANVNQATGAINGAAQSSTIHTNGQLNNAAEFSNQIIAYRNGAPVRLKRCRQCALTAWKIPYGGSWYKNHRTIALAITRQPGSNTVGVIDKIKAVLPHFEAGLPPAVKLEVMYDQSDQYPQFHLRRAEHAADCRPACGGRDFRLPAPCLRHHHSLAGAAHRGDRHLCRHGACSGSVSTICPDGADAVGGLCGRRRHRDAGKYRPPYRAGRKAL